MNKASFALILTLLLMFSMSHTVMADNGNHYGEEKQEVNISSQSHSNNGNTQNASHDPSVEPGNSGTQGKSQSDPDGITNGGADKPGGTGGINTSDQDGNNGCGNDSDFEDDNNGKCLGLKKQLAMVITPTPIQTEPTPTVTPTATPTLTVTPTPIQAILATSTVAGQPEKGEVQGITSLPNTGNTILKIALLMQLIAVIVFTVGLVIPSRLMAKDY